MGPRTALVLIGAVAVIGVVTGTTLASWRDEESLNAGELRSGALTFSVTKPNDGTSTALGTVTLDAGQKAVPIEATLRNTSPLGAKNLRFNVRVTAVNRLATSSTAFSLSQLLLDLRAKTGDSCTALDLRTMKTADQPLSGQNLNSVPLRPGQDLPICITTAARDAMADGLTGNLELTFEAVQVP